MPSCRYCEAVGGVCWPHRAGVARMLDVPAYEATILGWGAEGGPALARPRAPAPPVDPRPLYARFGRSPRWRPDCGVLCAADASAYPGLRLMLASLLLSHDVPVTVFDLGLSTDQRGWLARQPVSVVVPDLPAGIRFEPAQWAKWAKPPLLDRSPYDVTVWLDADILVDRDLSALAETARLMGLVIFPDRFAAESILRNEPELDAARPVPAPLPSCNSGVIAYRKGDPVVAKAADLVREIVTGTLSPEHFSCWDQGVIQHALESLGVAPVDAPGWNRPGWTTAEMGTPMDLSAVLARCEPGTITHFQAGPKPWASWSDYPLSLRPAPGLTVFVLGHDGRVYDHPRREWLVPVNLSERDPDQSWGECRIFDQMEAIGIPETPYVGLVSHRWADKYPPSITTPPWEFGELDLRPDTVLCAARTDVLTWLPYPDWADHSEHYNPGIKPLIAELRAVSGLVEAGPSAWSNNWIMPRAVFLDLLAFYRRMKAYFLGKYPECPYRSAIPPRTWAYLGESISVHYLSSRGDLMFREMIRNPDVEATTSVPRSSKPRIALGITQHG